MLGAKDSINKIGYTKTEDPYMIPKTPSFKYLLRSFDSAAAHAITKVIEERIEVIVADHENRCFGFSSELL